MQILRIKNLEIFTEQSVLHTKGNINLAEVYFYTFYLKVNLRKINCLNHVGSDGDV